MLMLGAWYVSLLATLFVLICVFMILVILIQKPRGGGLSGAFGGGGGSSQAVFGAKAGDVLTWFTVFCFGAFLVLAIGLTWSIKPGNEEVVPTIVSDMGQSPQQSQADQPPADPTSQPPEGTP